MHGNGSAEFVQVLTDCNTIAVLYRLELHCENVILSTRTPAGFEPAS
jgi:hypothetical protein